MRAFFLFVALTLFLAHPVFADTNCQPIYGGGQTCTNSSISIEKDVVNPVTNNDVHDLGTNDPNFHPGDTITFHITVRNNGSNVISSATVKDNFPQFVTFVNGPGTFDTGNQTLTFQVGNLAPNQSQTFTIQGSIFSQSNLPPLAQNCAVNEAVVTTADNQSAQDSSQFCISSNQQSVLGTQATPTFAAPQVIQTPATGASPIVLGMLFVLGISGFSILRLSKRKGLPL